MTTMVVRVGSSAQIKEFDLDDEQLTKYVDMVALDTRRQEVERIILSMPQGDMYLSPYSRHMTREEYSAYCYKQGLPVYPTLWRSRYINYTGNAFHNTLYARDEYEARRLCHLRGEEFVGYAGYGNPTPPCLASRLLSAGKYAQANHAAHWLVMTAVRAGIVHNAEHIQDEGILHGLAHVLEAMAFGSHVDQYHIGKIMTDIGELEQKVPGMIPVLSSNDPAIIAYERNLFFGIER